MRPRPELECVAGPREGPRAPRDPLDEPEQAVGRTADLRPRAMARARGESPWTRRLAPDRSLQSTSGRRSTTVTWRPSNQPAITSGFVSPDFAVWKALPLL